MLSISQTDTVRKALAVMTAALVAAGIESAATDARLLLQGVLGVDAAALIRDPDRLVGKKAELLDGAVARRLAHEPVSRILGTRGFYGREFLVTPDVLDPRADTETLVDAVLETIRARGRLADRLTIAEIGTGSGAIIITLLVELPNARGVATDVSEAALSVAAANAQRLGVHDRLTLVKTSGLKGVDFSPDFVVSNPPYIPAGSIAALDPDVRNYDPRLALDGGPDGLAVYREIARDIKGLTRTLSVWLEIGAGQADEVEAIFVAEGAAVGPRRTDLGGHVRVVVLEIHR